jgi:hypothetical protein
VVLTTPPRRKFVTKLQIKEYGKGYVRQPQFFKICRATEERGRKERKNFGGKSFLKKGRLEY